MRKLLSIVILGSILFFQSTLSFVAYADEKEWQVIDRQRAFVSQFNKVLEKEQLLKEAKRQAAERRRSQINNRRAEAQISAQFAGLSKKLSKMPQLPSFEGKFTPAVSMPSKEKSQTRYS